MVESIVDILRRCGPGALPESRLPLEMRRRWPSSRYDRERLRKVIEAAGDRILLMEVVPDSPVGHALPLMPLESWVVLTSRGDAPDRSRLASLLWGSLVALAADVEPHSRVSVSRWVVRARRAGSAHDRMVGQAT